MNILIIQTAFLGDFLLTLPFVEGVREKYPGSRIYILGRPFIKEILSGTSYEKNLITYDKSGTEGGFFNIINKIMEIKKKNIDVVFCPHLSMRSAILSFFSGAKERRGFDKSAGRFLFSKVFHYEFKNGKNYIEKLFNLLPDFNTEIKNDFNLYYDKNIEPGITNKFPKENNYIGLGIGSNWQIKQYPAEKWAEIISLLIKKNYLPVLIGDRRDEKFAADLMKGLKETETEKITDLTGKTDLIYLRHLLRHLSGVISNDNAILHLADLLKIPVLGIFGPTTRELGFYPSGNKSSVIEKELACRPCGLHGARKCKYKIQKCFDIPAEKTVEKLTELLEK